MENGVVQTLNVETQWPGLFDLLNTRQRWSVVQSLASTWHDGWKPNFDDVQDLVEVTDSVITIDTYMHRAREKAIGRAGQSESDDVPADPSPDNAPFDTWKSYFYPETYNPRIGQGTLRNLASLRSPDALRDFEYSTTALRARQLLSDPTLIDRTYDSDHVRAIHAYLFQDVYAWAGRYRTVNIGKGVISFADANGGEIDVYLVDAQWLISAKPWADLDHDGFASAAASVFSYLNHAHPFRAGNGRVIKILMEHLAEQTSFTFRFDLIPPDMWNQASMFSSPNLGEYGPQSKVLEPIFRRITVERTDPVQ